MSQNIFSDGFPKDPSQAVDFSYFLSDKEKSEWHEWLKTASQEHKSELVDTLHAMWVENESKKPKEEVKPSNSLAVDEDTDDEVQDKKEVPKSKPQDTEKTKEVEEVPARKEVKEEPRQTSADFVKSPKPAKNIGLDKYLNIEEMESSKNQSAINNIYEEFKNSRQSQENTLQKMMDSFVKFDRLETYFQILASRTNELNGLVVSQAKDISELKITLKNEIEDDESRYQSVQDQVLDLSKQVDIISRDIRLLRKDFRESYKEFSSQISASSTDIYKPEGVFENIQLLSARIKKLENSNIQKNSKQTQTPGNNSKDALNNFKTRSLDKKHEEEKNNSKKSIPKTRIRGKNKEREWL